LSKEPGPKESTPASSGAAAIRTHVDLDVDIERIIRWVAIVCIGSELLFLFLDYHVNYGRLTDSGPLRRITNIAREDSLASWFGTTQTLFISLTLWMLWASVKEHGTRFQSRGWLVLACFFSFMTIDDGVQLHERAGTVFRSVFEHDSEDGPPGGVFSQVLEVFPSYAWQIIILPIFVALGVFLLFFLWRELRSSSRWLVVVAVGLDFIEGLDDDHPWNLYTIMVENIDFGDWTQYRFRTTPFKTLAHFSKAIEEFLEMFANTLLWLAFLTHVRDTVARIDARIR
jgi:hypothetical protein